MHLLNTRAGCFCVSVYPVWQETHGKAVSPTGSHSSHGGSFIHHRAGNEDSCRKGKDGEREGITGMGRMRHYKAIPN